MVHSANKQSLLNLKHLPEARRYFIAFSGGMDSTALIHALLRTKIKAKMVAIHVNHNIHRHSEQWQQHCESFCNVHQIPFITEAVHLNNTSENECRLARQHVFERHLSSEDCLLTGHHQSDQVETIVFKLLRGTGLQGMTGMHVLSIHSKYQVFRPMLQTPKLAIENYVKTHDLRYVNDPSNQDIAYRRNFIRNKMLPIIKSYNPDALQQICLTSDHLKQSLNLLSELIGTVNPIIINQSKDALQLSTTIYHWLHNFKVIPPSHKRLYQFSSDCIQSTLDKQTELTTKQVKLVCWKKNIYALKPCHFVIPNSLSIVLQNNKPVSLGDFGGQLCISSNQPVKLEATICYGKGVKSIQLAGHQQRHKIKTLFQSHNIPPWERHCIPYLFIDNQLMAIGSVFISIAFKNLLDRLNAEYEWLSPQFLL